MAAARGVLPGRSPQTAAMRQRAGLVVPARSGCASRSGSGTFGCPMPMTTRLDGELDMPLHWEMGDPGRAMGRWRTHRCERAPGAQGRHGASDTLVRFPATDKL